MLRGFDLPTFRKDIQREIRQTKQAPLISFGLTGSTRSNAVRVIEASFRELLDIDGNQETGILPMHVPKEEALALVGARRVG